MEFVITQLDQVNVIGKQARFNMLTAEDIPEFWVRFLRRSADIPKRTDVRFGICTQHNGDQFLYLAGFEVKEANEYPDDLVHFCVPAGTYAVFQHRGPVANLHKTYDYIYRQWLPESGFSRGTGPELERYDERFLGPDSEDSVLELYVPVLKKR